MSFPDPASLCAFVGCISPACPTPVAAYISSKELESRVGIHEVEITVCVEHGDAVRAIARESNIG